MLSPKAAISIFAGAIKVQKTTTYFIIYDEDELQAYNNALKELVPEVWTLSKFEFANEKRL